MNIQEEYNKLMSEALYQGKKKSDRTGTGTLSVFGRTIRHDMSEGFPLLTTKKVWFNAALTEILWIFKVELILHIYNSTKYIIGMLITKDQVEQIIL